LKLLENEALELQHLPASGQLRGWWNLVGSRLLDLVNMIIR